MANLPDFGVRLKLYSSKYLQCIPAVTIIAFLELEQIISFVEGHFLTEKNAPERGRHHFFSDLGLKLWKLVNPVSTLKPFLLQFFQISAPCHGTQKILKPVGQ